MKEAAAAAASGATQDEATSTTPPTSSSTSVAPMQVEHPKDEVIPVTGTADADQPDVEISEAALKRSEDEDVPESREGPQDQWLGSVLHGYRGRSASRV